MKMTKKQTVYQMAFLPRMFPVNCYFVEEEDGLTLIDAALPYSAGPIQQAARKIGKPITRIVLTHAHDDHVGALDKLKAALPEVPLHISRRDSRLLAGDRSLEAGEPDTPIRGGVPVKLKTNTADVLLEDGDRVGSLLAVSAPGHTPGLMAFYDTRNGSLIAGDALQTRSRVAVAGTTVPLFPFIKFGTWNHEKALLSARKLIALNPTLLAVGHGKMLNKPVPAMAGAIEVAERFLAKR